MLIFLLKNRALGDYDLSYEDIRLYVMMRVISLGFWIRTRVREQTGNGHKYFLWNVLIDCGTYGSFYFVSAEETTKETSGVIKQPLCGR